MKFLFLLSLFCISLAASRAATAMGFYKDPKHPGKCVVDDLILSAGEVAQESDFCGRKICYENGVVNFHTCGAIAPPPGYKLGDPIKPDAPYPDCCSRALIPIA